jgi:hypothetical protein
MDLKSWVEPLFTYGPYAAVVLFLSVALYLLKGWRQVGPDNRVQQVVYGFYAAASWIVVIIAVRYIYVNWPPTMVYSGSFGTYAALPAKFFSQSSRLFVRSTPTPDGRLKWEYVIVVRQPVDDAGAFEFTYQWGADQANYGDYRLDLATLKQGHTNVTADPNQPGKLFYDSNDAATPKQPLQIAAARPLSRPLVAAGVPIAAAYAQARPANSVVLQWLDSPDPNLRAQARALLRQMPPAELKALLSSPALSESARQQIQKQAR